MGEHHHECNFVGCKEKITWHVSGNHFCTRHIIILFDKLLRVNYDKVRRYIK